MKEFKYITLFTILIVGTIIIFLITTNSNSLLIDKTKNNCQTIGYCNNLTYIKFKNVDKYHTFIIYKKNKNGFLAVLNDTYKQTSFSTPTDCYQGGCNDGTEIFTNSNHNLGVLLNHEFLNLLPSNYKDYLNFSSWSVGNVQKTNTGNAYIGLVSYQDWENMKDNSSFHQNINKPYWLSNSTNDLPYRIYVIDDNNLIISAPNIPNAYARPVIELKYNINIQSGDGTIKSPFII